MTYFRELPNLNYQSTSSDRSSSEDYVVVKNIFRRAKLRDDLKYVFTSLVDYYIRDGVRPDQVADDVYGDPELDWVVLTSANVINVRDEWPLDSYEIYNYSLNKYGKDLNQIRHYETTEVVNSTGVVIVPEGMHVESDYSIQFYDSPAERYTIKYPVKSVSNYEYEAKIEDEKRNIYLLKPRYINIAKDDLEEMMAYKKGSTQYVSETLKSADNIRLFQ